MHFFCFLLCHSVRLYAIGELCVLCAGYCDVVAITHAQRALPRHSRHNLAHQGTLPTHSVQPY